MWDTPLFRDRLAIWQPLQLVPTCNVTLSRTRGQTGRPRSLQDPACHAAGHMPQQNYGMDTVSRSAWFCFVCLCGRAVSVPYAVRLKALGCYMLLCTSEGAAGGRGSVLVCQWRGQLLTLSTE